MRKKETPCKTCKDKPCKSYLNEDGECWFHSAGEDTMAKVKAQEKERDGQR